MSSDCTNKPVSGVVLLECKAKQFESWLPRLPNKLLIIRPSTNTELVYWHLLYTATSFSCSDQPSSGRCRIHKIKYKGREASLYSLSNYYYIIPKNWIIRNIFYHINNKSNFNTSCIPCINLYNVYQRTK